MSRRHLAMLITLGALWGASFMFIKVGDRELEPITLVGFRMALGALTLVPIVLATVGARRTLRELRAAAWPLIVTGLVNSAIPIYSITWAETRIDSGLTAIIQASAPLFTALLAIRFSHSERVTGSRLAGLFVGFAGVALLVGGQPSGDIVAGLAVVFSAVCYAAAALYTAKRLRNVSPLVTALGALTAAALATLPAGLFQLPDHVTGWKVTASVLTLGIAGTGLAYILYYGLLAGAGASRAILITYLVPAFAVFYGAVLLGEPVTALAVGGLALVLTGIALGTGGIGLGRLRPVASSET
ncbi:MAG TPA: DMT family transporter [Gaiellaceae bacterium]|jgi:drug/metabolite transporter (DMT)-like permease|nr:DMT family transporter [Gaiellaceae bacterium]